MKPWYVYLVECSDRSLYCGSTPYVYKRIQKHNEGKGAKYTRSRLPVNLIDFIKIETKEEALKIERIIKKKKRNKKVETLQDLKN